VTLVWRARDNMSHIVAMKRWSVETDSKWALGDTNTVMYEQVEKKEKK